jgi:hypothetical protein
MPDKKIMTSVSVVGKPDVCFSARAACGKALVKRYAAPIIVV